MRIILEIWNRRKAGSTVDLSVLLDSVLLLLSLQLKLLLDLLRDLVNIFELSLFALGSEDGCGGSLPRCFPKLAVRILPVITQLGVHLLCLRPV